MTVGEADAMAAGHDAHDTHDEHDDHGHDAPIQADHGHVDHDDHGHGHDDHGDDGSFWVVPPLVLGLIIGIILVAVFGLASGAPAIG